MISCSSRSYNALTGFVEFFILISATSLVGIRAVLMIQSNMTMMLILQQTNKFVSITELFIQAMMICTWIKTTQISDLRSANNLTRSDINIGTNRVFWLSHANVSNDFHISSWEMMCSYLHLIAIELDVILVLTGTSTTNHLILIMKYFKKSTLLSSWNWQSTSNSMRWHLMTCFSSTIFLIILQWNISIRICRLVVLVIIQKNFNDNSFGIGWECFW